MKLQLLMRKANIKEVWPLHCSCMKFLWSIIYLRRKEVLTEHIIYMVRLWLWNELDTAWKVSKYGVSFGPYFSVFALNTERYFRIQSEYRKIRTRNNSVFGHFSRSVNLTWLLNSKPNQQFHVRNLLKIFSFIFDIGAIPERVGLV